MSIKSLKIKLKGMLAEAKNRKERISRYIEYRRVRRIGRHSVPRYNNCKNCGEPLRGMYCHKCGQYALDVDAPFWKYIKTFLDNAYQLDGKVFQTIRYIFTKPGFLSTEYVKGKVSSYVHPLKFFMFASIIFFSFALTIYSGEFYSEKFATSSETTYELRFAAKLGELTPLERIDLARLLKVAPLVDTIDVARSTPDSQRVDSMVGRAILKKIISMPHDDREDLYRQFDIAKGDSAALLSMDSDIESIRDSNQKRKLLLGDVMSGVSKYFPFLFLILMPVYAFMLRLSYRRTHPVYMHSFVFSIHVHAVFMILLILCAVLYPVVGLWVGKVLFPLFLIYYILATKEFYARSWLSSIVKSIVNLVLYCIVMAICVGIVALIILVIASAKYV